MKVERQGVDECMLATLAALAGVPLASVRGMALAHAGISNWGVIHRFPDAFWTTTEYVAAQLGLTPVVLEARMEVYFHVVAGGIPELPMQGKGTVLVQCSYSFHIMPWEDGLVYDPDSDHPEIGVTLNTYRDSHPAAVAIHVTTL